MKRLMVSLIILSVITFLACFGDDDIPQDTDCVTCTKSADDDFTLCNRNGQAVFDGVNIGGSYEQELSDAEAAGYTCE